jgi:hypothetical protein
MSSTPDTGDRIVCWHRELPPLDAEPIGEHSIEADSDRVPGTIARRDDLWDSCERGLTRALEQRLTVEVTRLGGRYAHVLDEHIDVKHDFTTGQAWLHGRYTYMLYR